MEPCKSCGKPHAQFIANAKEWIYLRITKQEIEIETSVSVNYAKVIRKLRLIIAWQN